MAWHTTWNEPPQRKRGLLGGSGGRRSGVKIIVLITVAVYILDAVTRVALRAPIGLLTHYGALRVDNAPFLYPFLTYQFLHAGLWHIGLNMLVLWMLGRHIERELGTRQFVYLYFLAGVLGGVCQVALNVIMTRWYGPAMLASPTVGASGGVMGILVAFAVLYPREELYVLVGFFFLPVQARWVALVYFLIESYAAYDAIATGARGHVANAAHVGGMVLGFVWMKWGTRIVARMPRGARRPRPGSFERNREREQAELDRILKKVHERGVDSLTLREKMFLQDVGNKYRD